MIVALLLLLISYDDYFTGTELLGACLPSFHFDANRTIQTITIENWVSFSHAQTLNRGCIRSDSSDRCVIYCVV